MTFRNDQPQKNQTGTMRPNISGQLLVHTGQKMLMAGSGYLTERAEGNDSNDPYESYIPT